jgi:hypothetical protein
VNPKWHYQIKLFNVKIAALNLHGPLKNKSFISKKGFMHQFVVKTAEQKLVHHLTQDTVAVATEGQDNHSRLLVQIVVQKTQYHFNQKVIDRFFAETVFKSRETKGNKSPKLQN